MINAERNTGGNMYRLRDLKNGLFQIHVSEGPAFEGSSKAIFKKCFELGIDYSEIDIAISEINKMNHDFADFGIFGKFIYTGKDSKTRAA